MCTAGGDAGVVVSKGSLADSIGGRHLMLTEKEVVGVTDQ